MGLQSTKLCGQTDLTTTIEIKAFYQASWGRLDMKPNKNKRKPKQEGERKKE
jgi:hypothetical protein